MEDEWELYSNHKLFDKIVNDSCVIEESIVQITKEE